MKKIRILRITTVASQHNLLLKGQHSFFNNNGFEVIAMSSYDSHVKELVERENCKWIYVPMVRSISPFKDLWSLIVLLFYIIKLKPDIVHTHSPKAGLVGQIASFLCKTPTRIHTVAGLPLVEYKGIKKLMLFYLEKLTCAFAHQVLPNSNNLAKYLIENHIVNKNKIKIIGNGSTNGVDLNYFSVSENIRLSSEGLKKSFRIYDNAQVLLFVGRISKSKGIAELINSFINLSANNKNLYLIIVGNFDERDILNSKIKDIIVNHDKIITTGHQKDIRPYLNMADIFVFPSYREGLPQSLLQACAMLKCCVATNINGNDEIIFDKVNGVLVPVKDVYQLEKSINKLLGKNNQRDHFGLLARKFVEKKYDQNLIWNELLNLYMYNYKKNI